MGVNDKTGLYNLEPRDTQWVEKLFGDYHGCFYHIINSFWNKRKFKEKKRVMEIY